jgi:hypothetical protein
MFEPALLMSASPVLEYPAPRDDPVAYTVSCFPARQNNCVSDLSLTQLNNPDYRKKLQDILPAEKRTYFAPTADMFSGVILPQKSFTDIHTIDRLRSVMRPGYLKSDSNQRIPCDGTVIGKRDGFIMTAGGCPLIVLTGTSIDGADICIVAHAGRESLIDRQAVLKNRPSRVYFSVVNAMAAYARNKCKARIETLVLRSFFALPSKRFIHDPCAANLKHRDYNRRLHKYLNEQGYSVALYSAGGKICFCLSELIRLQAEQEGILTVDTSQRGLPEYGDHAYTQHPDEELRGDIRNLVVLTRPLK